MARPRMRPKRVADASRVVAPLNLDPGHVHDWTSWAAAARFDWRYYARCCPCGAAEYLSCEHAHGELSGRYAAANYSEREA